MQPKRQGCSPVKKLERRDDCPPVKNAKVRSPCESLERRDDVPPEPPQLVLCVVAHMLRGWPGKIIFALLAPWEKTLEKFKNKTNQNQNHPLTLRTLEMFKNNLFGFQFTCPRRARCYRACQGPFWFQTCFHTWCTGTWSPWRELPGSLGSCCRRLWRNAAAGRRAPF